MLNNVWVEELRPKILDDVIGNEMAIRVIKEHIESNSVTGYLFSGNPGVGKTTIALCIARALFGSTSSSHFAEINTSDENGIDVVRGKIKKIAQANTDKIILLDEMDYISKEAQAALRRTIEKYYKNTIFIGTCNYQHKIIPAIQSRLQPIHFAPLTTPEMNMLIDRVCTKKSIVVSPEIREIIFRYAKGDARRVINPLQSASMLGNTITKEAIQVFTQTPDLDTARLIMNTAISGDFISAREMLLNMFINKGFDYELICEAILEVAKDAKFTEDKNRNNRLIATINAIIANHSHYMSQSNPIIEFSGILAKISMIQNIQSVEQVI